MININDLKNRTLDNTYLAIYAIRNDVKVNVNDKIVTKPLYTMIGITNMGRRKFIGCFIENVDDTRFWLDRFEVLKQRGVQNVLYMASDDNYNFKRCFHIAYPNALLIPMSTSVISSIYKYFSDTFSTKIGNQIRDLYIQDSIELLNEKLSLLYDAHQNNHIMKILFDRYLSNIKDLYKYDLEIRKFLFNGYMLKLMHREIDKKHREFGTITKSDDITGLIFGKINQLERGGSYTKKEWITILNSFYEQFPDQIELLI